MDLYNKYRPRKPEELYVTSSFVETLPKLILETKEGKDSLPHAMIFNSLVPGSGKTTIARIIASELNEDISDEEREDIFMGRRNPIVTEIGAGSTYKDTLVRLEEWINHLEHSMYDRKYIIIINEAHNLTSAGQQVLLDRFSENIPDNVYVILTTTEMHKMIEALLTRFHQYDFYPPSDNDMKDMILDISEKEGFTGMENELIADIIDRSGGSMRKACLLAERYIRKGISVVEDLEKISKEEEKQSRVISRLISTIIRASHDVSITWESVHRDAWAAFQVVPSTIRRRELMIDEINKILNSGNGIISKPQSAYAISELIEFVLKDMYDQKMFMLNLYKTHFNIRKEFVLRKK